MPQSRQLYCSFAIALSIACLRTRFHLPVPVREVAMVVHLTCVACTSLCSVLWLLVACACGALCVRLLWLQAACVVCGGVARGLGRGRLGVGVILCPCLARRTPGRVASGVRPGRMSRPPALCATGGLTVGDVWVTRPGPPCL